MDCVTSTKKLLSLWSHSFGRLCAKRYAGTEGCHSWGVFSQLQSFFDFPKLNTEPPFLLGQIDR